MLILYCLYCQGLNSEWLRSWGGLNHTECSYFNHVIFLAVLQIELPSLLLFLPENPWKMCIIQSAQTVGVMTIADAGGGKRGTAGRLFLCFRNL